MNSHRDFLVTSVSGALEINNPWVWDSHNISSMIKMLNPYMTKRETQLISLGFLIVRCSPDSQYEINTRTKSKSRKLKELGKTTLASIRNIREITVKTEMEK